MSRWWRAYDEAVDDPKLQKLKPELFKAWFNLCCITSQNNGCLPDMDAIAFKLRCSTSKARAMVVELRAAGLIDNDDDGLRPHNWSGRQFQSDGSTERVKRFRQQKRNVSSTVSETPPDTEQKQKGDDEDDAHAQPLIGPQAIKLSAELAEICGHDRNFLPPEWFGAPYRIQQWLDKGWNCDVIRASAREQVGKKRDGPPSRIEYFEKGIAAFIARQNAPLPNVVEIAPAKVEVSRATSSNSASAVARRVTGEIERAIAEKDGMDYEPYRPDLVRLPAR